ncbi:MAG: hypothetical protein JXR64_12930 [Spirochaetales bacterium]|nr:hypothetical protein [Spirochaetales bacterium]
MKKYISIYLIYFASSLFGADLYTHFYMDNFHFNDNGVISSNDYDFIYGEDVSQLITPGLYLDAGFNKTLISDYSIYTDFRITNDLFGFNLGIFTNFLNDSSKILTPGLNYGLNFTIPGIIILNLDLNNTIPNTSPLESGVSISNYDIKLGFYMGDAILSLNLISENNTKGNLLSSTSNAINKYFFNIDLFNKYSKYRISIDLGWNYISRIMTTLSTDDSNNLSASLIDEKQAGSAYINTKFTILAIENISIDAGLLLHLIKVPLKGVGSFANDEFSWGFNLGLLLKL